MSIATSSKTSTTVAALAALGLSAAAGFAYWGVQNWDKFNSDYYKDGYSEELKQEDKKPYEDQSKNELGAMIPVTPGYQIPADIIPGYRLPGGMPDSVYDGLTEPEQKKMDGFTTTTIDEPSIPQEQPKKPDEQQNWNIPVKDKLPEMEWSATASATTTSEADLPNDEGKMNKK